MEDREADMRDEYDFSTARRGRHHQAYRAGHSVRVIKGDGTVEMLHFSLADGAVMLIRTSRRCFPTPNLSTERCGRWSPRGDLRGPALAVDRAANSRSQANVAVPRDALGGQSP